MKVFSICFDFYSAFIILIPLGFYHLLDIIFLFFSDSVIIETNWVIFFLLECIFVRFQPLMLDSIIL